MHIVSSPSRMQIQNGHVVLTKHPLQTQEPQRLPTYNSMPYCCILENGRARKTQPPKRAKKKQNHTTHLLLAHRTNDSDQKILARLEIILDLLPHLALRHAHVVLGRAVLQHQVQKAVVDVDL